MGGHAFGHLHDAIADPNFVRILLVIVLILIVVTIRAAAKTISQRVEAVGKILDVGTCNQQQREQGDNHEYDDREHLRQPPCERRSQQEAEHTACILEDRQIETVGVGRHDGIDDRANRPQQQHPARHHTRIVGILAGIAHQTERHNREEHRKYNAHHTECAGGERMQETSQGPVDPEPFGSAEQHRKNHHHKAQAVTPVHRVILADAGERPDRSAETARNGEQQLLPQRLLADETLVVRQYAGACRIFRTGTFR